MYNGEFNGAFVNVNASENQEMITSNHVLEDGFLEETVEEKFLNKEERLYLIPTPTYQ